MRVSTNATANRAHQIALSQIVIDNFKSLENETSSNLLLHCRDSPRRRSGVRGWASRCNASRNLQAHTFDCILAECKAAVEERRDIANFRGVCEDIFEKVLRLRLHLAEADANWHQSEVQGRHGYERADVPP